MITDLIFDFFGTLVQYQARRFHGEPYQRTYAALTAAGATIAYEDFAAGFAATFDRLEADSKRTHREFHMHDVGREFLAGLGLRLPPAGLGDLMALYCGEWNRGTVYPEGIAPFVRRLAGRYRLSIISNTHYPPLIHENLAAMGVAGQFAQVVTSVEMGMRKPHPAIFAHAFERLGIAPRAAVYVGDSYADDYAGALAAGLPCLLIDPDDSHRGSAPHRIGSLFDLEQSPLLAG